jgi:hypothetical protein
MGERTMRDKPLYISQGYPLFVIDDGEVLPIVGWVNRDDVSPTLVPLVMQSDGTAVEFYPSSAIETYDTREQARAAIGVDRPAAG